MRCSEGSYFRGLYPQGVSVFRDEDDEKKLAEETEKEPSVRKEEKESCVGS